MQYGEFARLYDGLMADVDYDGWAAYLASFLPAGAAAAECACGTGAITLRLARMGFRVTGLDISPSMLEVAAEKARQAGLRIPFVCQDMAGLALHRPVDAVIAACDGVNYLTEQAELKGFFSAAHSALRPGGQLLFDISSPYKIEAVLGCNTFGEDDGETAYLWRNLYDPESRLIEMNLTFFLREGSRYRRFTERHVQRAHLPEELCAALRQAGFSVAGVYAALTREPPGERTERIQFRAVKGA